MPSFVFQDFFLFDKHSTLRNHVQQRLKLIHPLKYSSLPFLFLWYLKKKTFINEQYKTLSEICFGLCIFSKTYTLWFGEGRRELLVIKLCMDLPSRCWQLQKGTEAILWSASMLHFTWADQGSKLQLFPLSTLGDSVSSLCGQQPS